MALEVELTTQAQLDVELATQDPLEVSLLPLHRLTQHFDFDSSDATAGYVITRKADGTFDMQAGGGGGGGATLVHTHLDASNGGLLTAAAIDSGTFADARIASSSVTQHINDAGTGLTDFWSASKIAAEIASGDSAVTAAYIAADSVVTAAYIAADVVVTNAYIAADAAVTAAYIAADVVVTNAYIAADVVVAGDAATALSNHELDTSTHGVAEVAGIADINTLIGVHAALSTTHGVTGNIVGTGGAQTLLLKTLTSPTINTPTIPATEWTNSNHAHTAANSGGLLDAAAIGSGTFANARISASSVTQHLVGEKGVTIEFPTNAEAGILLFRAEKAVTITELRGVHIGGSTPSVTVNVVQGTDISAAGTNVKTGMVITSTTTGDAHTSGFTDATVPAGSYVWIDTTAESGGPDAMVFTAKFDVD